MRHVIKTYDLVENASDFCACEWQCVALGVSVRQHGGETPDPGERRVVRHVVGAPPGGPTRHVRCETVQQVQCSAISGRARCNLAMRDPGHWRGQVRLRKNRFDENRATSVCRPPTTGKPLIRGPDLSILALTGAAPSAVGCASETHQLVMITSLPFVHTASRSSRLTGPVNNTDRRANDLCSGKFGEPYL